MTPTPDIANPRVEAGIPFVEALARRMAATMPHSIDLSDLVQDGVIGLIDAAHRFDDSRGIKFETFAERRIRGAMIDALRKDAWPRGVRRVRRELEAAREKLRKTLGHEPSLADLAHEIGSDEKRLGKTIVRINTIESTSPFSSAENVDESQLPAVMVPAEPERPDMQYERDEVKNRVRNAIATLPPREQRVVALYYYNETTMKDIGAELGVNESRVSQLHARAIKRLREALGLFGWWTPLYALFWIAVLLRVWHAPLNGPDVEFRWGWLAEQMLGLGSRWSYRRLLSRFVFFSPSRKA